MFSTILAVIKAIPAIKALVDSFVSFYIEQELSTMREENKAAVRKAINEHDQRDIEKALGSVNTGKPSGDSGASIVDPEFVHKS